MPKAIAAAGETRPEATGRSAVRAIMRSMSRSTAWLIAPAPPAERAPPRQVRRIRPERGVAGHVHRRHRGEEQQRLHLRLGQRQVVADDGGRRERAAAVGSGAVCAPAPDCMALRLPAGTRAPPPARRGGCGGRSPRGCRAAGGRCGRRGGRRSCAAPAARARTTRACRRPRGRGRPRGRLGAAEDRVEDRQQDADEEDEDADRGDHVVGGDAGAAEVLVGVDHLALVGAGEEERHEAEQQADDDRPEGDPGRGCSPIVRPVIFGNQ